MAIVRKAYAADFDRIYRLKGLLPANSASKEDWRQLFSPPWNNGGEPVGYVLVADNEIVGFLGTIFSLRVIKGKVIKYCNLTTWVVREEHRRESLYLLLQLNDLEEHTITAFTASDKTAIMLRALGFKELGCGRMIVFPAPSIKAMLTARRVSLISDPARIAESLSGEELKIFNDHATLKCRHFIIHSLQGDCYCVVSRLQKRGLPVAHLHYAGNINVFLAHINAARMPLLFRMKAVCLMVENRLVGGASLPMSIKYPLPEPCPQLFISDLLQVGDVDNLYSEKVLLNF